jgi:UDPglucose 6-dehydrogenase
LYPMARIVIVGSGVVGTATGRGFYEVGHNVTFIDVLPERVQQLRAEGFSAQSDIALSDEPTYIFLTLPTPHAGRRYELSALADGVTAVGRAMAESPVAHTVVVRSTVPPGTTEGMIKPLLEQESGKFPGEGFGLACSPEFLREASADADFRHPRMTVIASRDLQTRRRLSDLLSPFGGQTRLFANPATAELIKCSHNIFNAAKISFWNEMWLVANSIGVDPDDVSSAVALSAEASFNPQYGIRGGAAYGGACLPKDTIGFLGFAAEHGLAMPILEAVVHTNERLNELQGQRIDTQAAALPDPAALEPSLSDEPAEYSMTGQS